jgi:hypothetical protein
MFGIASPRPPRPPGCRRRPPTRPAVEQLEERAVPATVVTTLLDETDPADGLLSLREALEAANNTAEADNITFQAGLSGVLSLALGQMTISEPVTITGNGAANTVIDAQQNSRIFDVTDTAGDVTLDGLTLRNGQTAVADELGGAIRFGSDGTLAVRNSTLSGNSTTGNGGAGGAISSAAGAVTVRNSTLSGNSTAGNGAPGGALFTNDGAVTVRDSTLSGNFTTNVSPGGAISSRFGAVTVSNSTLSGNFTVNNQARGGALHSGTGPVTVSNSTLSGNSTGGSNSDGGAISSDSGAVTLINSTLVFNQAGNSTGGGIFSLLAPVTVQNSIVARNSDDGTAPDLRPSPDAVNGPLTVRSSLIGNNTGTGLAAAPPPGPDANGNFIGGSGVNALNPLLGPLANNGGPTLTHALLAGSPARDRGDNALAVDPQNNPLVTDQRGPGFTRFGGTVDIGAFEVQPPPPPPPLPLPSPPPPPPSPSASPPLPVVEIQVTRVKRRTRVDVLVGGALRRFFPFGAFTGRVQILLADVNGDGLPDVIAWATIHGKRRTRTFLT